MISQERLKIDIKLLLSVNRKPYTAVCCVDWHNTLGDLEWPFHASRAISAVAELLVYKWRRLRKTIAAVRATTAYCRLDDRMGIRPVAYYS